MKELTRAKVKALIQTIEENRNLLNALFIYIGTLYVLIAFPSFSIYVAPLVATIPAIIGYNNPKIGVIASVLLANISILYQTPILGWLFSIILSATMVVAFKEWYIIPILEIIVFAPFTGYVGEFGGVILPLIFISSLKLGARRSLSITIPAVFLVLYLSAMMGVHNNAYLPINVESYDEIKYNIPSELLSRTNPPADILDVGGVISTAFENAFSKEVFEYLSRFMVTSSGVIIHLLFGDIGLLVIGSFAGIIYISSLIPGIIRHRYEQTIASIAMWLYLPIYYMLTLLSNSYFDDSIIIFLGLTSLTILVLDDKGIYIAGETEYRLRRKEKKLSKYGIQDVGLTSKVKFEDIGNYEDVKKELRDAIMTPMFHKDISIAYGLKPPKGILLFGPPGTGKTLMMRALANELQIGFYYVKASNLLSHYLGESEKNVSEVFKIARENAPAVLFFDEIDSIGVNREYLTSDDAAMRVLSTMLQEMDGLESDTKVIIVGATNAPDLLDPALLRPGRLDKIIYMHLPDREGRLRILRVHMRDIPVADDVNLEKIAKKTERFSGADLKNLCNEAIRLAAKKSLENNEIVPVKMEDFEKVMEYIKPSTSLEMIDKYERFKLDFERRAGKTEVKNEDENIKWEDVIGLDDIRDIIKDAVELPLLHPELLEKYEVEPPRGMLMFGPPGCGKTMIVKAAANELKANLVTISGADLLKKGYEGAVATIKETFNRARENPPTIVFIDEIESMAPSRDLYNSKFVEDIVTELLREMDGFKKAKGVFVIGATNKPDMLDPAIIRPGRLDKLLFVPPPGKREREEMYKYYLKNVPTKAIDYEELAKLSEGFTGADIKSVCQSAKYKLIKRELKGRKASLTMEDLRGIIEHRKPSINTKLLMIYREFIEKYGQRK